MLEAPLALLAWALLLLDDPPKALVLGEDLLLGTCRLPTLFPPPLLRFAPVSAGRAPVFDPDRFAAVPLRLLALAVVCCSPLVAAAHSPVLFAWNPHEQYRRTYSRLPCSSRELRRGAGELCCQLLFPLRFALLTLFLL